VHRIGARAYEAHLQEKKNGYDGTGVDCSGCGQSAKFHDYRKKTPLGLMGRFTCQRAYYYCGRCGQGQSPWDQVVGLTTRSFTPAAERLVSLSGALSDSFAESSERVLPEMAGLHVCETRVQRTTEAAGARVGAHLEKGHAFGFPYPWDWHVDAQGRTCAYVSLDLTGVRQQAEDGGKADGRMPYVAMVYNPVPEMPPAAPPETTPDAAPRSPAQKKMQARYLSGLYDLAELGVQLRKQAQQVGMEKADRWIALTDGGNGLEDFVRRNFPRRPIVILDFWHAADHLRDLAQVLHPSDEEERHKLLEGWCHVLKHEGGRRMIEVLQEMVLPNSAVVKQTRAEVLSYFQSNKHRMAYPKYLAKGWSIGSGAVESACKTVVGQRLKLAGMRWRPYGTDTMCHLRALFKSEACQWNAFWKRSVN
jgi:hypothetical protein